MTFVAVASRLKVTGYTKAVEDSIWADLELAYAESPTARKMFDDWIAVPGNTIQITYVGDAARAYLNTGKVEFDPTYPVGETYITPHGKAFEHTQTTILVHELGHALAGLDDNYDVQAGYFTGDNVKFVNVIFEELGLSPMVSYLG